MISSIAWPFSLEIPCSETWRKLHLTNSSLSVKLKRHFCTKNLEFIGLLKGIKTRFFHNSIKKRLNKNKLVSLTLDDGSRIFDIPSIKREVTNHFSALLGPDPLPYPGKASLAPFVSKRLEDHHQVALALDISLLRK